MSGLLILKQEQNLDTYYIHVLHAKMQMQNKPELHKSRSLQVNIHLALLSSKFSSLGASAGGPTVS
jgi:hypothetical protein